MDKVKYAMLLLQLLVMLAAATAVPTVAVSAEAAAAASAAVTTVEEENANTSLNPNDPRTFLFPFIIISPDSCTTTDATYTSGVCYKSSDCTNLGGTAAGNCAKGLGVCCYFKYTCGDTIASSPANFVNPSTPSTDSGPLTCVATVDLINDNICQLKLDFLDFEIAQPNVFDGVCQTDTMIVTGTTSDSTVPRLCGYNTGQHMYVDVDPTGANPKINIDLGLITPDQGRTWNINVTQIECTSPSKGCRRYYTATSGEVQSYNYVQPTAADLGQPNPGTANLHLANMDYRICVEPQAEYCEIIWTPEPNNQYAFMMTHDGPGSIPLIGEDGGILDPFDATDPCDDYVIIPGGMYTAGGAETSRDRFCGLAFPDEVTSTSQPFMMHVVTDDQELLPISDRNTGFSLQYRQVPC